MAYTTIDNPELYFQTKLYTGNGSTQSITGVGFQPDWCWLKSRAGDNVSNHRSVDSVRGATKELFQDATSAEETNTNGLTAFNSNGFSLGSSGGTNNSNTTYASWNWKAGGTASSNTDGSITSTVSANTTAGFSIVSFTGTAANATVGHGLGVAPACFITKSRVNAENWGFYHQSLGNGKQLELNTTAAQKTSSAYYNNTSPTSTVFSIGTADSTNDNQNMICYCFAEKKGYSKFGSYTGNGNADGTFVYTGFKPSLVIAKSSSASHDWIILDNKRSNPFNPVDGNLFPNNTDAEGTATKRFDFTSQGFKNRSAGTGANESGTTYIYMAFAENPFVTSSGVPTTAR